MRSAVIAGPRSPDQQLRLPRPTGHTLGSRYALGYTPTVFGIWNRESDALVYPYELSDSGREQAWNQFVLLEHAPAAQRGGRSFVWLSYEDIQLVQGSLVEQRTEPPKREGRGQRGVQTPEGPTNSGRSLHSVCVESSLYSVGVTLQIRKRGVWMLIPIPFAIILGSLPADIVDRLKLALLRALRTLLQGVAGAIPAAGPGSVMLSTSYWSALGYGCLTAVAAAVVSLLMNIADFLPEDPTVKTQAS